MKNHETEVHKAGTSVQVTSSSIEEVPKALRIVADRIDRALAKNAFGRAWCDVKAQGETICLSWMTLAFLSLAGIVRDFRWASGLENPLASGVEMFTSWAIENMCFVLCLSVLVQVVLNCFRDDDNDIDDDDDDSADFTLREVTQGA